MRLIAFLLLILVPTIALAGGGGDAHGDPHAIPWGMILQQLFNLSLALFIIVYFFGGKIGQHFAQRKEEFSQLLRKAEEAKVSAEKNKREITERLQKLESTSESTIKEAKAEAETLKKKILDDALHLSQRLEEEAARTATFEVERAKLKLRNELLEKSLEKSKSSLVSEVDGSKSQQLNKQFISHLQVSQ